MSGRWDMGKVMEGNLFYYRWGSENVGILIDNHEVGREIIEALNKAQGIE
jgi:hypothetical protein